MILGAGSVHNVGAYRSVRAPHLWFARMRRSAERLRMVSVTAYDAQCFRGCDLNVCAHRTCTSQTSFFTLNPPSCYRHRLVEANANERGGKLGARNAKKLDTGPLNVRMSVFTILDHRGHNNCGGANKCGSPPDPKALDVDRPYCVRFDASHV
jgi:hypothetical protein